MVCGHTAVVTDRREKEMYGEMAAVGAERDNADEEEKRKKKKKKKKEEKEEEGGCWTAFTKRKGVEEKDTEMERRLQQTGLTRRRRREGAVERDQQGEEPPVGLGVGSSGLAGGVAGGRDSGGWRGWQKKKLVAPVC